MQKRKKALYFRIFNGIFFFTVFEQGASRGIYKEKMGTDYMKLYKGSTKFKSLIEFSVEESNTSIKGQRKFMPSLKKVEMAE